jgi:hypothetical protein
MASRWRVALGLIVGVASLSLFRTPPRPAIRPEPIEKSRSSSTNNPEEAPATPGLASPWVDKPRVPTVHIPQPRTKIQLEFVDPWDGGALPEEQIVATAHSRLEFDRKDPWNPDVMHPAAPSPGDPFLDPGDPWATNPARPDAVQRAVEARDDNPRRRALDDTDPWALAPEVSATTSSAEAPPTPPADTSLL